MAAANGKSTMAFGTNFWWIGWGDGTADPFREGYRNVTGEDPWKTDWIEEIRQAPYQVLRTMDWNQTNNAQRQHPGLKWAQRRKKNDRVQQPMAYEWQVDFCNRTGKDLWLCIPHFAAEDDEYLANLAELVLDQLDPGLDLFLEYSNEAWFAGFFDQGDYTNERGLEKGFDEDPHDAGQKYLVHCSLNIWRQFDRVFGEQSDRLVRVLCGRRQGDQVPPQMAALHSSEINPEGESFDMWATNGYFGHHTESWEELRAAMAESVQSLARLRDTIPGHVDFGCYEAGQHVWDEDYSWDFNTDPRIYDLYMDYFDQASAYLDLFVHYVHVGTGGQGNANQWGARTSMDQPLDEAHKWRAILDWCRRHPAPRYEP